MTKARLMADLIDNNGDVVSGALDNVPAADLVNDTSPQLGGELDTNGNAIRFGASKWTIELDTGDNDLNFKYKLL